jgi:hypothetical protein
MGEGRDIGMTPKIGIFLGQVKVFVSVQLPAVNLQQKTNS